MQPSLSHSLWFLEDLAYSYAKENYVLRLQVFPGELLSSVVDILSPLVRLDPKSFTHVLSVVCISDNVIMTPSPPLADTVKEVKATEGEQAEQDRAERVSFYYGLVSRQQFWSVETAIHSIPMNRLTRAHFKLREALERMKEPLELPINIKKEYFHQRKSGEGGGVMVQQDWEKRFIAVDVGASPGGWTQYLSTFASLVIAVDPAALRINPLPPNVVHLQMKSEEAVPYIKQLVAAREQTEQPAQDKEQQGIVIEKGATEDHHKDGEKKEVDANKNGNQVDLITCDMNQSAEIVAGILGDVVPLLRVGGHLVLTLKFPRRTEKNIKDKVEAIKAEFVAKFPDFDVLRVLWLLSNINERTLFAVKRENRAEGQTC
ncbi:FtsJ domain-containing protein [Balamuthia mandrillaris]